MVDPATSHHGLGRLCHRGRADRGDPRFARITPCCRRKPAQGPSDCSRGCCGSTVCPHGVLIALGFVAMMAAGVAFLLVLYACERGMIPVRTVVTLTVAYTPRSCCCRCCSRATCSATPTTAASSRSTGGTRTSTRPPTTRPTTSPGTSGPDGATRPRSTGRCSCGSPPRSPPCSTPSPTRSSRSARWRWARRLGSVWFVYRLMQHVRPSKTAYAVAFIGLNPVVLFHTVGGGHVDALVMLVDRRRDLPRRDRPRPTRHGGAHVRRAGEGLGGRAARCC